MALNLEMNIENLEESASARGGVWVILLAALRSRYFLMSLGFYALLLILFGSYAVSVYVPMHDTFRPDRLLVLPKRTVLPPVVIREEPVAETRDAAIPVRMSMSESTDERLTVESPSDFVQVVMPIVAPILRPGGLKFKTDIRERYETAKIERLKNVLEFQKDWIRQDHPNKKYLKAEFTIFQAKYQDGDWNCNPGSLPNLMLQIRAWSKDRIKADLYPKVLDVGTEQLFELKPPFVYLTGHKDFRLLDTEVRNIRDYLMLGGAVWGDSALAGRRSRFDVAFRREMNRVMPDRDWEIIDTRHPMFNTFFRSTDLPSGMNYYQEPVEIINIGDEVAVIYTLNGYGHFWESRLNKEGKIEWGLVNVGVLGKPSWVHVYGPHALNGVLYRNISDKTVQDSYKFGINVVVHLLTRYQEYFKFLPKTLPAARGLRDSAAREKEDDEAIGNSAPEQDHKRLGAVTTDTNVLRIDPGLFNK